MKNKSETNGKGLAHDSKPFNEKSNFDTFNGDFSVDKYSHFWHLKQDAYEKCCICKVGIDKDDFFLNRSLCQRCRQPKQIVSQPLTESRHISGKIIELNFCGCGKVHAEGVYCSGINSRLSAFDRLNQFGVFLGVQNG